MAIASRYGIIARLSQQEFRGFVKGGVLTALTQYNHVLFSQRLFDARARVAAALRRYFAERIAPRIGAAFDAYVVDFAICGHLGPSVTALGDDTHLRHVCRWKAIIATNNSATLPITVQ